MMLLVRSNRKKAKRKDRQEAIARLRPGVEAAFDEISQYYNFSHFITETERLKLAERYGALDREVQPLLNSKELDESIEKEAFLRFHTAMSDTRAHKKSNNDHFVHNEL